MADWSVISAKIFQQEEELKFGKFNKELAQEILQCSMNFEELMQIYPAKRICGNKFINILVKHDLAIPPYHYCGEIIEKQTRMIEYKPGKR